MGVVSITQSDSIVPDRNFVELDIKLSLDNFNIALCAKYSLSIPIESCCFHELSAMATRWDIYSSLEEILALS